VFDCSGSIHDRHLQIHEHDVREQCGALLYGLIPVACFANQLEIIVDCDEGAKTLANDLVVVNDEDTDPGAVGHSESPSVEDVQVTATVVPTSNSLEILKSALISRARSLMMSIPMLPFAAMPAVSKP